ncbi:pyridoxal kinase [Endogone sp. FLAS-F59071]|nr:pyridoxal kinase [Endogone sp. FLAS-F59071]|eukprot:RUS20576.1 pyridoxal kinase [Endogone sp. FLAS-F59071]
MHSPSLSTTGYIGTAAGVRAVIKMAEELKRRNQRLVFVCDPVMGDDGKLYVNADVVPIYRQIMCIVDVATPNQFEAETLASRLITSLPTALQAVTAIHDLGPPYVIVTTLSLPDADIPQSLRSFPSASYPSLYCLGSHRPTRAASPHQFLITFPAYPGYFTGAGDLFSALVVARLAEAIEEEHNEIDVGIGAVSDMPPLARAVTKVVASVNAVVRRTSEAQRKAGISVGKGQKPDTIEVIRKCELQLVKGRAEIEKPPLGEEIKIVML